MSIRSTSVPALLIGLCLSSGCSSNTVSGRDAAVRANLTPELKTLAQRPIDVDNRVALTSDENLRMANQDLGRVFFFDRPSRLTRERIPR